MNRAIVFILLYELGIIAASLSQILLKKSANKERKSFLKEYLNWEVMVSYTILFLSSLCGLVAFKYIPMNLGPVLETSEYIFIVILSYFFFKEKINKRTIMGLILIIIGIIIFTMGG